MARHKQFDKEEVLTKAMETFWHYGYEGTSVQVLVKNMGINRGSLYDTFGDKFSLFKAAITHYENNVVKDNFARLKTPEASKNAIIELMYKFVEILTNDELRRGCLLTNTAVEVCPHDSDTSSLIATNYRSMEKSFLLALTNAQQKGEISSHHNLNVLAAYLTSSLQGLIVISKVNPDVNKLRDIVKTIVSVLD